jgi:hypothetical protein
MEFVHACSFFLCASASLRLKKDTTVTGHRLTLSSVIGRLQTCATASMGLPTTRMPRTSRGRHASRMVARRAYPVAWQFQGKGHTTFHPFFRGHSERSVTESKNPGFAMRRDSSSRLRPRKARDTRHAAYQPAA